VGKKILIVTGSPRRGGTTATLVKWIAEGAFDAGAEVKIVDACRLKYKNYGCAACYGCQNSEEYRCIIKDEASDLVASMPEYDALAFATPVYFMSFSAQIKMVIDRMFSLFKISPEKKSIEKAFTKTSFALVASSGGDSGSGLKLLRTTMEAIAGFAGQRLICFEHPFAPGPGGEIDEDLRLREKAMDFGAKLAK